MPPRKKTTDVGVTVLPSSMKELKDTLWKAADKVMIDALAATQDFSRDENQRLGTLRDTLLPQLVSGKLRVKDAERVVEEVV